MPTFQNRSGIKIVEILYVLSFLTCVPAVVCILAVSHVTLTHCASSVKTMYCVSHHHLHSDLLATRSDGLVTRWDKERQIFKTESHIRILLLANNETGYNIMLLVITKVIL